VIHAAPCCFEKLHIKKVMIMMVVEVMFVVIVAVVVKKQVQTEIIMRYI
jgi:hypothetical protein